MNPNMIHETVLARGKHTDLSDDNILAFALHHIPRLFASPVLAKCERHGDIAATLRLRIALAPIGASSIPRLRFAAMSP
jgi:hypothetical protein